MVKTTILAVTTLICKLFLANAILGGRTKITDVKNNQEVQELGRFSIEDYNRKAGSNGGLKFVKVVKAESQVVSGTKYYLKIEAKGGYSKFFYTKVMVKPWLLSKELLIFRSGVGNN